jgi:hypothetical protein
MYNNKYFIKIYLTFFIMNNYIFIYFIYRVNPIYIIYILYCIIYIECIKND